MSAEEDAERAIDKLIGEAVGVMARYGVTDPYDYRLNPDQFHALDRELGALWPKKRPGPKGRFNEDRIILWTLLQARKGRRSQAARKLEESFSKHGMRPMTWQTIRKRFYDLMRSVNNSAT